jgi:hypothetical protein
MVAVEIILSAEYCKEGIFLYRANLVIIEFSEYITVVNKVITIGKAIESFAS